MKKFTEIRKSQENFNKFYKNYKKIFWKMFFKILENFKSLYVYAENN